jgi:hypothetical protein
MADSKQNDSARPAICEWASVLNIDCAMQTCRQPAYARFHLSTNVWEYRCRKHAKKLLDEDRGLVADLEILQ